MASIDTLGIDTLSIRGANQEYNRLTRFYRTRAEAEAAIGEGGDWSITAGVLNACLTGDEGLLVYNEVSETLVNADSATKSYVDAQLATLVGDAPELLDTLGEISDAMGDDPAFFTTMATANTTLQSNIDTLQSSVEANETDIEDKVSDVNSALGLNVGDTTFTFTEDFLVVDVPDASATDHASIYDSISVGSADTATSLDIKTALDRFAKNSRIVLAAEKIRMDSETQRVSDLLGASGSDLGTFDKGFISDNTDVSTALQELSNSLAQVQNQAKVNNYQWSNSNDATISQTYVTTDTSDWANATKVYIHRKARHGVDMQNAFNNLLIDGARLFIQKTGDADKFFVANIDSASTVTGTGSDQVFEYSVTNVTTVGTVWNDNVEVSVGIFSNVNQKMVDAVQSDVDANEAASDAAEAALSGRLDVLEVDPTTATAVAAVQADVDANEVASDAADAALSGRLDTLEADPTTATALAAVQADVDQNESDSDAAEAALSGRLDTLEADPTTKSYVDGTTTAEAASRTAADDALDARLDVLEADPTTKTYVDTQVSGLIDAAPGALDTLNELAAAMGDDANFATTVTNQIAVVQADVDANEASALSGRNAIQADVDQNESDADAAIAAVQADVDQNESDADSAIAAVQADVDANEVDSDAADAALSGRLDTLEADPVTKAYVDGTTTTEALTRQAQDTTLQGNIDAVQADVDQNEADADAAIAGILDGTTFTGDLLLKKSDGSAVALKLSRTDHADMNTEFSIEPSYVNVNKECLNIMAGSDVIVAFDERKRVAINTTDPDYTLDVGGDGKFSTNLIVGQTLTLGSTAITATGAELNYVDGVTSNVQTQLDAIQADVNTNESDADTAIAAVQADVDQNESDADSAIAAVQADVDQNESDADAAIALKADIAGPTFTGVPAAPTASAGTNSTQVATTAFVTTAVANVIDSAPGALDTLNELAAALGDDANFSTTITNAINANETHIDNAVTLTGVAKDAVNLGTFTGSTVSDSRNIKQALQELETKVEAVQTDVDGNESDADSAIAAVQADVDQNESDADTAIAANETHIDNMATLTGVAKDATHLATFTGGTIADNQTVKAALQALETKVEAVQTDVDGNESDADSAIAGILDGCTFSGNVTVQGTVLANYLTLDNVNVNSTAGELNILDGATLDVDELNLLDGVTATTAELNYVDGVTSNIQTQLNAIQADVDGNESDADTAIAANETHIDNMATLTGVAKDATNVGNFTGSTISDGGTLKAGMQELETAVETKLSAETITMTAFKAVVAASSDFGDFQSRVAAL